MKIKNMFAALVILTTAFSLITPAQKMKPEEIISKHLDSIGKSEKRASIKNRILVGDAVVTFVTRKSPPAKGRIVLASEGEKLFWGMNLDSVDYPYERFIADGKKTKVFTIRTGGRSVLGNFISSNDFLIEQTLFGGALFTSWSLANPLDKKAKISSDGTKKINGRETYVLNYTPKGGSDIEIKLYFDQETFRHVRSEYARISSASIGRTIDESARQSESRLKVTEDFSDFKTIQDLTLPQTYTINYTIIGQNGTNEVVWKFNLSESAFNQKLDEKTFDMEGN